MANVNSLSQHADISVNASTPNTCDSNPFDLLMATCASCGAADTKLFEFNSNRYCFSCLFAMWERNDISDDDVDALIDKYPDDLARCTECNKLVLISDSTECDSEYYCDDCRDEYLTCCSECGDVIRADEAFSDDYGQQYCEYCFDRFFTTCHECGAVVRHEDAMSVHYYDGEHDVCDRCVSDVAWHCDDCDEIFAWSYAGPYRTADSTYICEDCYSDNYSTCSCCGEIYPEEYISWSDDAHDYICDNCRSRNSRRLMHDYSYKPEPTPRTRKGNQAACEQVTDLLLGVENEADKGRSLNDCLSKIVEIAGDKGVYIKHDSSLECGFEIVTAPSTLDYHMYEMPWRGICSTAIKYGFKSHDARTCGLHVHVGNYQLGDSPEERKRTQSRILVLVDRLWDRLVYFSRRKDYQLERWAKRPCVVRFGVPYHSESAVYDAASVRYQRGDRYYAVNLLANCGETTEFRMFNGTLKRNTIIATLQLVNNLCLYAKTHTMTECCSASFDDIVKFKEFKELNTYLAEQSIDSIDAPAVAINEDPNADTQGEASFNRDEADFNRFLRQMGYRPLDEVVHSNADLVAGLNVIIGQVSSAEDCFHLMGRSARIVEYGEVSSALSVRGYTSGHNLDGQLDDNSGWWVRNEFIWTHCYCCAPSADCDTCPCTIGYDLCTFSQDLDGTYHCELRND